MSEQIFMLRGFLNTKSYVYSLYASSAKPATLSVVGEKLLKRKAWIFNEIPLPKARLPKRKAPFHRISTSPCKRSGVRSSISIKSNESLQTQKSW